MHEFIRASLTFYALILFTLNVITTRNNNLARTLKVGRFAAGSFGLYDLHGNH